MNPAQAADISTYVQQRVASTKRNNTKEIWYQTMKTKLPRMVENAVQQLRSSINYLASINGHWEHRNTKVAFLDLEFYLEHTYKNNFKNIIEENTTKNPSLTLPIKIGKKYVRRDGKIIEAKPSIQEYSLHPYVLVGLEEEKPYKIQHHVVVSTGSVQLGRLCTHKFDLVADFIESEKPEPEDQQKMPYVCIDKKEIPISNLPLEIGKKYVLQDTSVVAITEKNFDLYQLYHLIKDHPPTPFVEKVVVGCPYAALLCAIAEGRKIEWQDPATDIWQDKPINQALMEIAKQEYSATRYRDKQQNTVTINGITFTEPCKTALEIGTTYWRPYFANLNNTYEESWQNDDIDNTFLKNGVVHLTQEAAQLHTRALLSFTKLFGT